MLHTSDIGYQAMSAQNPNSQNHLTIFHALLLSAFIVTLWLIPYFVMSLQEEGRGAGIWELFSVIALLLTILVPVVYGWYTKDTKASILLGVLPFLLVMTIPRLFASPGDAGSGYLVMTILYIVSLCSIGGLEGYFASRQEKKSLVIAIALTVLWIMVFLSGIK
jgi:hypothetical protein